MRRSLPLLAAALFAAITALLTPMKAEAGSVLAWSMPALAGETDAGLLTFAGYYGGYHHKSYDGGDDDIGYGGYGYDGNGYGHGYGYGHGRDCGYPRYVQKYVCDQTEPRCFRQREAIWYYGREYFRYVRKCVGGENYCKWISVPVNDCGCEDCD